MCRVIYMLWSHFSSLFLQDLQDKYLSKCKKHLILKNFINISGGYMVTCYETSSLVEDVRASKCMHACLQRNVCVRVCVLCCAVLELCVVGHGELAQATEKGQKRLNWVAPLGCQAAACFLGNRGVWLAARPCSVESHRIEANLNIHSFLSLAPSHTHRLTWLRRQTLGRAWILNPGMPTYGHIVPAENTHTYTCTEAQQDMTHQQHVSPTLSQPLSL